MKHKKAKLLIICLASLFIVCFIIYIKFIPIVSYIAEAFLVVRDPLEKADVLIVISGGFKAERVDRGIELYKMGYAKDLIFSGAMIYEELSSVDLWLRRAERLGIDSASVHLQKNATSTFENAVFAVRIMQENNYKTAILVTSPYHSRRAKWVFQSIFNKNGYKVISVPVERPQIIAKEKRARRIDIVVEEIIFEIQKTLFYRLVY